MIFDREQFLSDVQEAEMILVGLGEEFDFVKKNIKNAKYAEYYEMLEKSIFPWLLPVLQNDFDRNDTENTKIGLDKLIQCIAEKNYFVVSTSSNAGIPKMNWKYDRVVCPCGGMTLKQCEKKCENSIRETTDEEVALLYKSISEKTIWNHLENGFSEELGTCLSCGAPMVLNNVYAPNYDENSYLKKWDLYNKWLTGTLNKKLLVLELGAGLQFGTVIRFPFERIALINQKAKYYRIHESLFQMDEALSKKGIYIQQNAIEWLQML